MHSVHVCGDVHAMLCALAVCAAGATLAGGKLSSELMAKGAMTCVVMLKPN